MTPKKHEVPEELLSGLLANYKKLEDLIGENGLLKQLTKLLVEKALDAELTEHLGHERHEAVANASGNTRNGKSKKTLKGEFGELPIEVPRDRHGNFEPQLIPKHQTRWAGFDDKIISLYARGMTVREIQAHLQEMYATEVSPSLISSVTDAVSDEVKVWQARPLEPIYPIVYLDCIHVKVREGAVRVKAVYLAIGITMNGEKEVLGLWLTQTEGAKFWLQVVTELRNLNGLVRQYLPKGTDLSGYSQEQLDAIADEINNRQRKGLGVRSPLAVYTELLLNSPQHSTLIH